MLKPRGFVPWGLPGPTRGRRRVSGLDSELELAGLGPGMARRGTPTRSRRRGEGRGGVGPTDYTYSLPM